MKLTKPERSFTLIFVVIVLLELFSAQLQDILPIPFSPKPLILLSLIVFYLLASAGVGKVTNLLMLLALLFSLGGDIFLMYTDQNENMFIVGLLSFLLAHVLYIFVFNIKRTNRNVVRVILPLVLYALALLFLLIKGLNQLLIPVIVYMIAILAMVVFAFLRKDNVPNQSYAMVMIGAIFFVISDSILAINKFYEPIACAHFLIMATYALAQYLITLGVLRQNT